jgi:hypothetical protein
MIETLNVHQRSQRPIFLPKPLDEDGGGGSEEKVSELERHLLLAFEEQEKSSSATAPSSPQPHRYTEQSHPRIDQEHERGGTCYGSLEGIRHGSPLCNQDQEEKELQEQQQQQEVAADAMREGEEGDGDGDDREQRGKQGVSGRQMEEHEGLFW